MDETSKRPSGVGRWYILAGIAFLIFACLFIGWIVLVAYQLFYDCCTTTQGMILSWEPNPNPNFGGRVLHLRYGFYVPERGNAFVTDDTIILAEQYPDLEEGAPITIHYY